MKYFENNKFLFRTWNENLFTDTFHSLYFVILSFSLTFLTFFFFLFFFVLTDGRLVRRGFIPIINLCRDAQWSVRLEN